MSIEKMYTIKEASTILRLKVRTVRAYISTGRLKACKYKGGKNWFIKESDINELMESESDADKRK